MDKQHPLDETEQDKKLMKYRGYFDRAIYFNPVNKYCVLSIRTDDPAVPAECRSSYTYRDHLIRFTVTGYELPRTDAIEILWEGEWQSSKYGTQLQILQWEEIVPQTTEGIKGYLASGLLKGIGERTAEAIVTRFGLNALDVLEHSPERLLEIRGITKERLEDIKRSYAESRSLRDLMTMLAPFKVTPKAAQAIYQHFGVKSVEILRNSPYQLCQVSGFGFLRVDSIVQKNGGKLDDPMRIQAAIRYALEGGKNESGHLYLGREETLDEAFNLLNRNIPIPELRIGKGRVEELLQSMLLRGELYSTRDCIYLPQAFELEDETARRVAEILMERPKKAHIQATLRLVKKQLGITLSEKQERAVEAVFVHNLSIITGGPGTGKTTVLKAILGVYQKVYPGANILLAAPTGRASRRMAESTGFLDARTLHSALRIGTEEDALPEDKRSDIEADLIVVDETSMVDQWLARQFFTRIRPGTKVVLVGDADQLPSVGAGNVFHELIECGVIAVTVLDQIFRQAEDSRIAHNAQYIHQALTGLLYAIVSLLQREDLYSDELFDIGHKAYCVCCGEDLRYHDGINCNRCRSKVICKGCGREMDERDTIYDEEERAFYCQDCRPVCSQCHKGIQGTVFHALWHGQMSLQMCQACYEKLTAPCQGCMTASVCRVIGGHKFCRHTDWIPEAA